MFFITRNGNATSGGGFDTKREAQMFVNRNNAYAERHGDESKPYAFFEGEDSRVFEWSTDRKHLICTEMRLRNVSPGFQEVASTRTFEVYATNPLWAEGAAFANEVAAEDFLAGLEG